MKIKNILKPPPHRNTTWYNQWDFQGPPILGPLYGKFLILFPYHSHKQTGGPWKSPWFNAILPGNIQWFIHRCGSPDWISHGLIGSHYIDTGLTFLGSNERLPRSMSPDIRDYECLAWMWYWMVIKEYIDVKKKESFQSKMLQTSRILCRKMTLNCVWGRNPTKRAFITVFIGSCASQVVSGIWFIISTV